ncbi:MAG: SET domain-containing protein [bacterium]|nr:SET domain-containing protein [bacterium]
MKTNGLKKNLIKQLDATYCRLKASKISGVGVFAVRDIPKGLNPFATCKKNKWIKFSKKEINEFPKSIRKMIVDFYVYDHGYYYVSYGGLNAIDISFFLNHSKNPNLITRNGEIFIPKRKIRANEELTVDYKTYEPDGIMSIKNNTFINKRAVI